jgi:hypothetical protein
LKPFNGGSIAMHEDDFLWAESNRVLEQTFPAGVRAKIEFFDAATQFNGGQLDIKNDLLTILRRANAPRRRFGVRIPYEE